jgi:hypothetical protein
MASDKQRSDTDCHIDPEIPDFLSVKAALGARGLTPSLAKRIQDADRDDNGRLSISEIIDVFHSEHDAIAECRLLRRYGTDDSFLHPAFICAVLYCM